MVFLSHTWDPFSARMRIFISFVCRVDAFPVALIVVPFAAVSFVLMGDFDMGSLDKDHDLGSNVMGFYGLLSNITELAPVYVAAFDSASNRQKISQTKSVGSQATDHAIVPVHGRPKGKKAKVVVPLVTLELRRGLRRSKDRFMELSLPSLQSSTRNLKLL